MRGVKLLFGIVSDVDASKGLYRVNIDDEGIVSDWIPRVSLNTKNIKSEFNLDIGEHVSCLMDERCENGVILGAIYSEEDLPIVGDPDIQVTTYPDGSYVSYNHSNGDLTIDTTGDVLINSANNVNITATKLTVTGDVEITGDVEVTGDIDSTGTIKATIDVKAGIVPISLFSHTHSTSSPGSPTGIPIP